MGVCDSATNKDCRVAEGAESKADDVYYLVAFKQRPGSSVMGSQGTTYGPSTLHNYLSVNTWQWERVLPFQLHERASTTVGANPRLSPAEMGNGEIPGQAGNRPGLHSF